MIGLAACVTAIEFEQQQPYQQIQTGNYDYYYGQQAVSEAATDEEESRTHHKHKKLKKLKKRLLLQCLLQHHGHRRRRRDTASGRFLLPVVLQSTNVNVGSGGGYGEHQYGNGGSGGCMQMLNNHGPLGSLGSIGSGLLGSPAPVNEDTGDSIRNGMYAADWNRYARQFRRNVVRPLYQLF